MDLFAEIAVNIGGVDGVFDYQIPAAISDRLQPGCLVEIPYNAIQVQGVVVRIKKETDYRGEIKWISRLIKPTPVITPPYMHLAIDLSVAFHQPLSAFLQAMLPPGLSRRSYMLYTSVVPDDADLSQLQGIQLELLQMLASRGPQRSVQLDRAFSRRNWRKTMQLLIKNEWVQATSILPDPKATPKKVQNAMLHPHVNRAMIASADTGKAGGEAAERRRRLLMVLAKEKAPAQVSYLYASTGCNSSDIRLLEQKGLLIVGEETVIRDPVRGIQPEGSGIPQLTADQQRAWQGIQRELASSAPKPIMLRGITGSGKTELYLKAAELTVQLGKQALIMVPEIALTPQTVQRFLDRFSGTVGVFHSRLSDGERYDTWQRAVRGELPVLIGPRSALMVQLPNIGLIVLDECHDDSYYQLDQTPQYDCRDAALFLSKETGASVIFGSATPNVSQYFQALREKWPLIHLDQRIAAQGDTRPPGAEHVPLPLVEIVDMRAELTAGNSSIFSVALQTALQKTVSAGQQAILFLNRRGDATVIFCRDCGYTLNCPRCDFPLTLHTGSGLLQCHTCGYTRNMPQVCPACKSKRIRQYGMGTERVEQMLKQLIPSVRVLRWDADSVTGRNAEGVILSHFRNHNADVLVGTQMLAKGLDLPLVTLVGMVLADVGLNFPDYRASEHAFQLLAQVAGRAGRSQLGGKAILQTFQPDHYAIQFAATHDFPGFYQAELDRRRDIQYPPFSRLIRLETQDLYAENAERRAEALAVELNRRIDASVDKTLEMIGPVPPFFARQRGYYRWQIILKGHQPDNLLVDLALGNWQISVNPPRIL